MNPDPSHPVLVGRPEPLGVSLTADGAQVAVFSVDATAVYLCLFDSDHRETARLLLPGRTGAVHHGFVPGLAAGTLYGLRADGPFRPEEGLRFDVDKLLVDPFATRLAVPTHAKPGRTADGSDDLVRDGVDSAPFVPKGVIEAPCPPQPAFRGPAPSDRIIYELHVKGFTRTHPDIPPALCGTFAGLGHPASIGHLTRLGITTVELMPAAAWMDERHLPALGLTNYWGYNPIAFLAPDPRLAPGGMAEVAAAVANLHAAGIEVILDVVFNHTAESDERGETLSFRGLDNRTYYRLAEDRRHYINDTGCGHTLALDRPPVIRLVMDALRHWALAGGIDGFRFDLATVMGRRPGGFDRDAPLLAAIEQDPILRERVMIAEPWDIGPGGYQPGAFPGRWLEWNDRFRDDVRRFWRGDGSIGALATRLAGSQDVFGSNQRQPSSSVNLITAHDGFTLQDVVSFAGKDNFANGEDNKDGHAGEVSWVSQTPQADKLAMLATLLLARGTPMLSMGDEIGRSQRGNNNAYAQDNPTTWMDWSSIDDRLFTATAALVAARKALPVLRENRFLTGQGDVAWLDAAGRPLTDAGWSEGSPILGMALNSAEGHNPVVIWLNRQAESASVVLPDAGHERVWRTVVPGGSGSSLASFSACEVPARSVIVLSGVPGTATSRGQGVPDAMLDRLADLAGIAPEWWEVSGRHTIVSAATKRALLTAMGFPAASEADARDSLERLRQIRQQDSHEPTTATCHYPVGLRRQFGLAAQVYALRRRRDQGIGDFTSLCLLAERAARQGAATIALNPFHAGFPSDRNRASPYQPSDRRFLDPLMIDLDAVPEIGAARAFLEAQAGAIGALVDRRMIDHGAVFAIKRAALALAFAAMPDQRRAKLEAFRAAGGIDLARFALFQALEEEGGRPPVALPDRVPVHLVEAMDFAVYLQFLADAQLKAAADSGLSIGLYRDLAVGPAPDGAEVVTTPGTFLKGISIGAPPDPFSATGQLWNLPPLDPVEMVRSRFAHFRALLRANMRHAGALRIDHAMALTRLFLIPEGASPAEGTYVRYPLEGMLRVLAEESQAARCLVVGEDLGTVPEGFRERMDKANVLSYRVLFFEREGSGFLPPGRYPTKAVACVSTHDLPPLAGWWAGADLELDRRLGRPVAGDAQAQRAAERSALLPGEAATDGTLTPEASAALHGRIAATPSVLALVQCEELAGETEPVNVPGTTEDIYPNWRRRLTVGVDDLLETPQAHAILQAMHENGR